MKKVLDLGSVVLGIILVLWFIFSWVDVNAHNSTDEDYSSWNFFNIMENGDNE